MLKSVSPRKLRVLIYPEGRVLEVEIGGSRVRVSDLLQLLEKVAGVAGDYYAVALEGRLLNAEDLVEAGSEVILIPLVMGG